MEKEIAQKLKMSLPTVKSNFKNICITFGIKELSQGERRKIIYQIYCPLVEGASPSNEQLPPEKNEPKQPEPVTPISVPPGQVSSKPVPQENVSPEPELDEPDSSEKVKLAGKTPPPVGEIEIHQEKKRGTKRPPWPVVAILVVVLAVVCLIGALLLGNQLIPRVIQALGNAPSFMATEGVQPNSPQFFPTFTQIQQAPVVATNPPEPTTPILPTAVIPSISLPFSDNFDNGVNPAWEILSGSWLTADGRYTISNTDHVWAFSILDDPSWIDYQVKVNVVRSHQFSAAEGEEALIVRYLSSKSKYLVFYINTLDQAGWAYYDGRSFDFIAGYKSKAVQDQYDLEIDAVGNTFTAKINGMLAQQISISGYENGGVGLGVTCSMTPCVSYKNFQISSAP
jgi:hypothetical protein